MSRFVVCALLFAASGLLVAQRADPLGAQDKKDGKDPKDRIAALEKQVASLKQDLNVAAAQVNAARAEALQAAKEAAQAKGNNGKLQADNNQLDAALKKAKADGVKDDKAIKDLQSALDGWKKAGVVRVLVLKLKEDSPPDAVGTLITDAYALGKVKGVRGVWAGKPLAKASDAAKDYTVAVVIALEDAAALKALLKDTAYDKFEEPNLLKKWEPPAVYDFEPKKQP